MTENRFEEIFHSSAEALCRPVTGKNWEQQSSLVNGRGRVFTDSDSKSKPVHCLVAQFFDCSWCGIVIILLSLKSTVVHETSVLAAVQ